MATASLHDSNPSTWRKIPEVRSVTSNNDLLLRNGELARSWIAIGRRCGCEEGVGAATAAWITDVNRRLLETLPVQGFVASQSQKSHLLMKQSFQRINTKQADYKKSEHQLWADAGEEPAALCRRRRGEYGGRVVSENAPQVGAKMRRGQRGFRPSGHIRALVL